MIDYGIEDQHQAIGSSVGPAKVEVDHALNMGAIDRSNFTAFGQKEWNLPQFKIDQIYNSFPNPAGNDMHVVRNYLYRPQGNIDTAASMIKTMMGQVETSARAGKLSRSF